MDPLFMAFSLYRRKKFEKCAAICTDLLAKNPYDQAIWTLKMRALTEQFYVDEVEMNEEGISELLLDDNAIVKTARPGTSLKQIQTAKSGPSQAFRPTTQSGRPLSGFLRIGTASGQQETLEQALRTARTSHSPRPVSVASGRHARLGTASMLSNPDGPFINVPQLNLPKYATKQNIAKSLFEYLFHYENDIKSALELAFQSSVVCQNKDWWWLQQLAKCYYRVGMFRDCEKRLKVALDLQPMVDIYLYLCKVFIKLDQPLSAVDTFLRGLEKFPGDVFLRIGIARIYENMGDMDKAVGHYKEVLQSDGMNVEALASIATNHFYSDQPEIALKLYRRLVQMGVHNAELYNNIGLSCFYAQQYDMTLSCFDRALSLAADDITSADIWYNISHVALAIGDTTLAYQCLRLTFSYNNDHAEAYNNLGVLELMRGNPEQGRAFLQASFILTPHLYETHFNTAIMSEKCGDLQTSYKSVIRSIDAFPEHADSKTLLRRLNKQLSLL